MKSIIKKVILITLILAVLVLAISILMSLKDKNTYKYESDIVNNYNANALQIENEKITNLTERSNKELIATTEIKNISDLNLSQINLYYEELDKNDNEGSKSKVIIDMTLKPKDIMEVQFMPKDYTNTIEIIGYTYIVEDCEVYVDLKDNDIKIKENNKYIENSKNYEVLSINKKEKKYKSKSIEDTASIIEIENISRKNLGNIVLKVGEVDKNNKFIKINHITFNSILKPEERGEIISTLSNLKYSPIILGYTYDDMENKSNIDIDLITHKVNIIDNK